MATTRIELPLYPDETDYISSLPDDILCFILSGLPIKEVVRTSILARRFQFVWTWVPCLDLDPQLMIPEGMRVETLTPYHRSLATHHLIWLMKNHQGPMRRLQIVHSFVDGLHLLPRYWLRMISTQRLINELSLVSEPLNNELKVDMDLSVGIFHEMFCLHTLELTNYVIRDVAAFLYCTNLKSMTLKRVNVSGLSLSRVISQCPNLEILRMKSIECLYDLKVHSNKLEVMEISHIELSSVDIWCENLRALALDNFFCSITAITMNKISIVVPKVEYVRIHSYLDVGDEFHYKFEVQEKFDANDEEGGEMIWFQVFDNAVLLLSHINKSKPYLKLQDTESFNMNPLKNFKELRLSINVNGTGGVVSLSDVFKQCINLQMLSITIELNNVVLDCNLPYPKETFWEYVECCVGVEEELRNVCIANFTGRDLEVGLVRFLASRAKKLQRMVIIHRRGQRLTRAERYFTRNLRAMLKANENASIEFRF